MGQSVGGRKWENPQEKPPGALQEEVHLSQSIFLSHYSSLEYFIFTYFILKLPDPNI